MAATTLGVCMYLMVMLVILLVCPEFIYQVMNYSNVPLYRKVMVAIICTVHIILLQVLLMSIVRIVVDFLITFTHACRAHHGGLFMQFYHRNIGWVLVLNLILLIMIVGLAVFKTCFLTMCESALLNTDSALNLRVWYNTNFHLRGQFDWHKYDRYPGKYVMKWLNNMHWVYGAVAFIDLLFLLCMANSNNTIHSMAPTTNSHNT